MGKIVPFEFNDVLTEAVKMPCIKIERDEFLKHNFSPKFDDDMVRKIVQTNPIRAGVRGSVLDEIARECIDYEQLKVSVLSFGTGFIGLPGVPADLAQYLAHVLRISQKLAYVYGYPKIISVESSMDEKTKGMILLFIGLMYGVNSANKVITEVSKSLAGKLAKDIGKTAVTKTAWYPLLKELGKSVGIKVTKDYVTKGVGKAIPILGAVVSAGVSYYAFGEGSERLYESLRKNPVR